MNPYKVAKLINEKLSPELKKEIEGIKEASDNWDADLYDIFKQNDKDLYAAAEKYLDSQSGKWTPPKMKVAVIGSGLKKKPAAKKKPIEVSIMSKSPSSKKFIVWNNKLEQIWANETFDTIAEASKFALQNGLKITFTSNASQLKPAAKKKAIPKWMSEKAVEWDNYIDNKVISAKPKKKPYSAPAAKKGESGMWTLKEPKDGSWKTDHMIGRKYSAGHEADAIKYHEYMVKARMGVMADHKIEIDKHNKVISAKPKKKPYSAPADQKFDFVYEVGSGTRKYYIKSFLSLPVSASVKKGSASSVPGLNTYYATDTGLKKLEKFYPNNSYGHKQTIGVDRLITEEEAADEEFNEWMSEEAMEWDNSIDNSDAPFAKKVPRAKYAVGDLIRIKGLTGPRTITKRAYHWVEDPTKKEWMYWYDGKQINGVWEHEVRMRLAGVLDKKKPTDTYQDKYKGIFGDIDGDGIPNADDPNPQIAGDKETVEEVLISEEIKALIDYRESQDEIRKEFVAMVEKKAKGEESVESRTKTPFSIINKMRRKRLVSKIDKQSNSFAQGTQGLTDVIGAMVVFKTQAALDAFKKQVKAGLFGKVVEFNDYYEKPQNGYKAYHFGLIYKGSPIELQCKTLRMKKIGEANHTLYKEGKNDAKLLLALTDVMEQADAGDTGSQNLIDPIISNPAKLNEYLTKTKIEVPKWGIKKLDKVWGKYFDISETGKYTTVPVKDIVSEKQNSSKSKIAALLLMHEAGNGKIDKRVPITVKKVGNKYVIVDGNASYAAVVYSNWESMPVEVVSASAGAARMSKPTVKVVDKKKTELDNATVEIKCFSDRADGPYLGSKKRLPDDDTLKFKAVKGAVTAQFLDGTGAGFNETYRVGNYELYKAMVNPATWDNKGNTGWVSDMSPNGVFRALTGKLSGKNECEALEMILVCLSRMQKPHGNRAPDKIAAASKAGSKGWMASEVTKGKRGDYKHFTMDQVLAHAQKFQASRSKSAQTRDGSSDSKKRLSPTPENLVRWMNNPGGFDLIGIDTFSKDDPTSNLKIKLDVWWNAQG
jgi:ppGpp synthetase/RelA/SpoT-type nucleotidyltranferase